MGVIVGGMGAGSLLGGFIALRTRPRRPLVFSTVAVALFGLPLAFLAMRAPVPALVAATFVSGAGLMISNTVWESTLQRHIPEHLLSRVVAYDWFGSMAIQPIGLALWGPVAALIGISEALWIAFALQAASTLALLALREIRELPPAPATAAVSGA